ncbi:FtsH protease activity modulator HflK [Buchnera aphidicola]|uniref:FtsH protease activity modulator HflK n=1 Tax=Buchnera aphidicola TaxID=9 RepID=UPI003464B2E8
MAWKKPNNCKSDIDPWGQNNSSNKKSSNRTDEKKIVKKTHLSDMKSFLYKISGTIINTNNSLQSSKKNGNPIGIMLFIIFFIWCFYGFYIIKDNERGVITTLGKFSNIVQPGLHWRPIFIKNVKIVDTTIIRELITKSSILTADDNVVYTEMNIKYKIINPEDYFFSVLYPDNSLRQATESAIRNVISHTTMNQILTEDRVWIKNNIQKNIEEIIKPYKMGIRILDVNTQVIEPPKFLKSSFNDVIVAYENHNQYIHEAKTYYQKIELQTNAQVKHILEDAKTYSAHIILEAEKEVSHFSQILPEYKKAKNITLKRLYLESMERILSNTKKIFIDQKNNPVLLLSLDQFFNNTKSINKPIRYYTNPNKVDVNFFVKNKHHHHFSPLPSNNIVEQRRINSIRSDIGKLEKK